VILDAVEIISTATFKEAFMPISFLKTTAGLSAFALVTACSSTSTPTPPPPSTALNFSTATTPPVALSALTQTRSAPANQITQAVYDEPTDTLTLDRTLATQVTLTGIDASHPANADLNLYTGADGKAIVAHTSGGEGYAVAFYDDATTPGDHRASTLMGGTASTTLTSSVLGNANYMGEYLGYAAQSAASLVNPADPITGRVNITLDGAGTSVLGGPIVTNRVLPNGTALADINLTPASTLLTNNAFNNLPITSAGLLLAPTSGTVSGAIFDGAAGGTDGEMIGTIVLNGNPGNCGTPGNSAAGGNISCILETGTFIGR
jgi:hypothetical protein